jgi:hypothetical protein
MVMSPIRAESQALLCWLEGQEKSTALLSSGIKGLMLVVHMLEIVLTIQHSSCHKHGQSIFY